MDFYTYINYIKKTLSFHIFVLLQLLSRMTPTRSQLLLALADGEVGKEEITLYNMELSLINLKKNVLTLKTFYDDHNLEITTVV